jgi:hypothetical protein
LTQRQILACRAPEVLPLSATSHHERLAILSPLFHMLEGIATLACMPLRFSPISARIPLHSRHNVAAEKNICYA